MQLGIFFLIILQQCVNSEPIIGTNLGGWQVLEPWITPSLFYRFLGKSHSAGVGMDQWTFCEALGQIEGNRVLRAHWDSWLIEDHIKGLAEREVEMVRLPIGDWVLTQYGPYIGCTDGAAEKIDWLLDVAYKYKIKVLLDIHSVRGSQNGFDNSGKTANVIWLDDNNFSHWPNQNAEWMGVFNQNTKKYDKINYTNLKWSINNVRILLDRWGNHPSLFGVEPVNEPWEYSDRDSLMQYYRIIRKIMQQQTPHLTFVFHDSFDFSTSWNDLFPDTEKVVLDSHYYTAWQSRMFNINDYCDVYHNELKVALDIKYDVWIGEWSLATDICGHWLGGFNDGQVEPQLNRYECQSVQCPQTYLPDDVAVGFDRTVEELGPFGSEYRTSVKKGMCSSDSKYFSNDQIQILGQCALNSFNNYVNGTFFWNFRTEIEERWSYVQAYDKGWIKPVKQKQQK